MTLKKSAIILSSQLVSVTGLLALLNNVPEVTGLVLVLVSFLLIFHICPNIVLTPKKFFLRFTFFYVLVVNSTVGTQNLHQNSSIYI